MKAREIIEALSKIDGELEVEFAWDGDRDFTYGIKEIEKTETICLTTPSCLTAPSKANSSKITILGC